MAPMSWRREWMGTRRRGEGEPALSNQSSSFLPVLFWGRLTREQARDGCDSLGVAKKNSSHPLPRKPAEQGVSQVFVVFPHDAPLGKRGDTYIIGGRWPPRGSDSWTCFSFHFAQPNSSNAWPADLPPAPFFFPVNACLHHEFQHPQHHAYRLRIWRI